MSMSQFRRGDILVGDKRKYKQAYHPIVYMNGSSQAPLAVIITHSPDYACNVLLKDSYTLGYKGVLKPSYFIAHLIQKLPEWGPYTKIGELTTADLNRIEQEVAGHPAITYEEYEEYTANGCPDHPVKQ